MATVMNVSQELDQQFQCYKFEQFEDIGLLMEEYWTTSFPIALIYLLLIFVGQNYMKARKGFNLQAPLILWSFCLAIFSIMGAVRTWSFMGTVLLRVGLKQSVCYSSFITHSTVKFWSSFFTFSKIIELGDTAFIILRKRPLIFVHWYHHSTVVIFTSFGYKNKMAAGGWFMTMNFGVHAVMYTYYTLKAARVNSPRMLSMLITSLQILQMFVGAMVSILTYIWRHEQGCDTTTMEQFFLSSILYSSYFILFAHFFRQAYIIPKVKNKTKSQ
ncbi:elongation of very long chain fatty acids protein 3 isoform X1 [Trichechus manatus latirostris]|uniref:Elongation of very long chain fatty acids protein n=2 Tax=Trichechus manatus latirostris TaxID=127582 RepID=A0A2Y9D9R0_TRIMA|nr:elongation of very long chain fatty acids protein 3 isoform X1 [Trichechus manatus latirostris]